MLLFPELCQVGKLEGLDHVLNRLTFFGSIYLVVICVSPTIITQSQTRFGNSDANISKCCDESYDEYSVISVFR